MRLLHNLTSSSSPRALAKRNPARLVLLCALIVPMVLAGCSSDSPTAPTPDPQTPGGGGGATAFNISVTTSATSASAGSPNPILVTVTVRRSDNGAAPANGTTASISTSLGNFDVAGTGPQSGVLELINGQAQVNFFPGGLAGTARIQVQLQNSFGSAAINIAEGDTFFLQSISPTSGSPDGGYTIRIDGGGFVEPVRVFVGGQIAEVRSVSSTQISVRAPQISLPAGQTRAADVSVTNAVASTDEATDTLPGVFTYRRSGGALQPQIFSVTPQSGPNEGGTRVTIQGEGFVSPVQVLFGSGSAAAFNGTEAQVESVSANQIIVTTPSATGFGQNNQDTTVSILVRNVNDGATALSTSAFQYGTSILITSISPNVVSWEGGDRVTVFGQGFDEPVSVSGGNVGQTPISVTGTEILFRASAVLVEDCEPVNASGAPATGPVGVTNIETGASATGPVLSYFGPPPPFINNITPSTIDEEGGNNLVLAGGNFAAPVQVTINGALTNVNSVSPTQVQLTSPVIAGASFDTVECDDNNDGTSGTRNIPTSNNLQFNLVNVETGCTTDNVQVAFTVNPADTSCQGDQGEPPPPAAPTAVFDFSVNGTEVSFTNLSLGSPTQVLWQFGDGGNSTSTQTNPTFDYGAPGTYTVTLTVSNDGGSDSTSQDVTVP